MKADKRTEYLTRDALLKLLSDDEVARVSTAETATRLGDGEEYVDLDRLDRGIQRAGGGSAVVMGSVLSKKAIREATWAAIAARLSGKKD